MQPEEFAARFPVSRETLTRLSAYHDLLIKWQRAINLVSPATLVDVWGRHIADSAQLASFLPQAAHCVDLGSGAGFPALVLAIMRPDLKIVCIESDQRKAEFLKTVSRETGAQAEILSCRIEAAALSFKPDIFTARALAPLRDLLGYGLMLAPDSGWGMVLLKGQKFAAEHAEAQKHFDFTCITQPSQIEKDGVIAVVSNVRAVSRPGE